MWTPRVYSMASYKFRRFYSLLLKERDGGKCCVARYGGVACVASKVDRIMLRFRPIAPKPAIGGSVSGLNPDGRSIDVPVKSARAAKRRCLRRGRSSSGGGGRKRRAFPDEKGSSEAAFVTLPLLPETPDMNEPSWSLVSDPSLSPPSNLSLRFDPIATRNESIGRVVAPQPVRPVGSWVTLDRVTGTCLDWAAGSDEEEMVVKTLDEDTCPGFISDGWNRVTWINEAYRRMVGGGEGEDVVVGLVLKETIPESLRAFACHVRVQYTCRKERHSATVPCDVWWMAKSGRFAWRLDMKAALSLGR